MATTTEVLIKSSPTKRETLAFLGTVAWCAERAADSTEKERDLAALRTIDGPAPQIGDRVTAGLVCGTGKGRLNGGVR
jgi:hypothetical protein